MPAEPLDPERAHARDPAADGGPDVDPFALPPVTTSQLVSLALGLGAGGLFAAYWSLVLRQEWWIRAEWSCVVTAARVADPIDAVGTLLDCTDRAAAARALATLAGPAVLTAAAVAGYLWAPRIIEWRRQVSPVAYAPHLVRTFAELTTAAGLAGRHRPQLVVESSGLDGQARARAYGRPGRYRVLVCATFLTGTKRGVPPELRQVLAHELGHLVNRDVARTYLAVSAWFAFLAVVAVPLAVDAAGRGSVSGPLIVRLAVVTSVVGYALTAVIRAREHDADLRAARLVTAEGAGVRAAAPPVRKGWTRWLHPSPRQRAQVLADPGHAQRWSARDTLVTAVAAGLVLTELPLAVEAFAPTRAAAVYPVVGTAVAVPLLGVVWLGALRAATVASARREPLAGAHRVGLAAAAGLLVGSIISPRGAAVWQAVFWTAPARGTSVAWWDGTATVVITLAGLLVALCVLAAAWLAGLARRLAGRHARWRAGPWAGHRVTGRTTWMAGLLLASPLWGMALGAWFLLARLAGPQPAPGRAAAAAVGAGALAVMATAALAAAVALLVAMLAVTNPQPAVTCRWLARHLALPALAAAVLGAVLLVTPRYADPHAGIQVTASPRTTSTYATCAWITGSAAMVLGRATDHGYQAEIAELLSHRDDPMLRHAGEVLRQAAAARDPELAAEAQRAVIRRCQIAPPDPSP